MRIPYIKWYPRDWLVSTADLQLESKGFYLDCLMLNFCDGKVPSNPDILARKLRLRPQIARRLLPKIIDRFEVVSEGYISHSRITADLKRYSNEAENQEAESGMNPVSVSVSSSSSSSSLKKRSPETEDAIRIWNEIAKACDLPQISKLTANRRVHLARRLAEHPDYWQQLQAAIEERGDWAKEQKLPSFDQAVNEGFFTKLIEGNYQRKGQNGDLELLRSAGFKTTTDRTVGLPRNGTGRNRAVFPGAPPTLP